MPSQPLIRQYQSHSYYHVYLRGVAKQKIFLDWEDKKKFLTLIDRFMFADIESNQKIHKFLEINAYCLMDNHFHFMFYMHDRVDVITSFMRRVLISYVAYFNKKYNRVGPLFESKFKAKLIEDEAHLLHLSRYIHLNPTDHLTNSTSSLRYYLGDAMPHWLKPDPVLASYSPVEYLRFIEGYDEHRAAFAAISIDKDLFSEY